MRARGCRVGMLLIAGGLAMLPAACSANSPATVSATKDAGLSATTVAAVGTSAADVATLPATPAASTTTIAVDFGDLGRDAFCTVATSVVGATGAFVPDATPEAVKNGFASLKASLATLADKGASEQRAQFAKAVEVLASADTTLAANGYDVAKTQDELATIDPDGALIGAITVVITQRQAACGT